MKINQNGVNKMEKINAIKQCYGIKAISAGETRKTSSGEIITSWEIEDIPDVKSLEKEYLDEEILIIYESGL